jgi:hypothetical protein
MAKAPKDPGPSQADIAAVEVAEHQWSDYVSRYRPAEVELIKRSEFTAGERARVQGEASADTAAAFSGLTRGATVASAVSGAGIGSGQHKLALADISKTAGMTKGAGKVAATLGGRLSSENEKLGITAVGRGVASNVASDLSRAGRRQTQVTLQKALLKAERQNQQIAAAATIAGAGVRKGMSMLDARAAQKLEAARSANTDLMGGGTGAPNFAANFYNQPFDGITDPMQSSHLNFLMGGSQ